MAKQAAVFTTNKTVAALLRERHITTLAQLARACDLPPHSVHCMMCSNPRGVFTKDGYTNTAQKIATFLRVIPEIIFGEDPTREERTKEAEAAFAMLYPPMGELSPEDVAAAELLREQTAEVLSQVTPREEAYLKERFFGDPSKMQAVLQVFDVTRERIEEIKASPRYKSFRHPNK